MGLGEFEWNKLQDVAPAASVKDAPKFQREPSVVRIGHIIQKVDPEAAFAEFSEAQPTAAFVSVPNPAAPH
jgi:hypothetical protein